MSAVSLRNLEWAPEPLELECGYWELNSVPMDKQPVPLTTSQISGPKKIGFKSRQDLLHEFTFPK